MGSACSSESGSYETSPSESSAESSETSSEDDSSNQVSSSVFFTEKSKLSGKEKLRRRTRSIVSGKIRVSLDFSNGFHLGIKIRSPKEEPLEIVQTTNKDGVSLIRKLRLIRRLGPLSRVVNAGANNIVVPEIRVIEAPNSEKSSADNKRASFFQRAKVARLNSLSKSATDSERNSTPHVSGKQTFTNIAMDCIYRIFFLRSYIKAAKRKFIDFFRKVLFLQESKDAGKSWILAKNDKVGGS